MQLFTKMKFAKGGESGAVLLVFVAAVTVLFIMAGMAVDTGNLYTIRLVSQGAVDAAAMSGAGLMARGKTQSEAIDGAREVAIANLEIMGIDRSRILNGFPQVQFVNNEMRVTIASDIPLHILKLLPGANFRTVAATATARVSPASVALILDTSDSMACPPTPSNLGEPCECMPNCPQGENSGNRLEALKDAVEIFLQFFDQQRDSISLTAFGHGAEVLVKANPGGFNYQTMLDEVNGLTAQGATNVCDGFIRAYLDMERIQRTGEAAYVYFSDGAPTAGRFFFVNSRNPDSFRFRNNILNRPWSNYDYLSWGVVQRGTDEEGNTAFRPVPQRVHKTPPDNSSAYDYWNPREFADIVPPQPPGNAVPFPWTKVPTNQPWRAFSDAVEDMQIFLPNGSIHNLGRGNLFSGSNYEWTEWFPDVEHLRLYADCALVMSDFMREAGGLFYGVGYGPAATVSADPYQNAVQSFERKDWFMTRIANDPCGLTLDKPPLPFPGIPTLQEMATSLTSSGSYFPTAETEELRGLFERIAVKVKLRMIR